MVLHETERIIRLKYLPNKLRNAVKSPVAVIAISLVVIAAGLSTAISAIPAKSAPLFAQTQIEENLVKFKYPYSEFSDDQRIPLAQYAVNNLTKQISNYQPGQGTTLSYLQNALLRERALLPSFPPPAAAPAPSSITAATTIKPVAINMIYYGSNGAGINQRIINAAPEYLVNNSPAGPAKGDANVLEYMSAGIKYFEYLDGGYEGTQARYVPNDLQSNLNYITAAANAGAYGVFLDEVSSDPDANSLDYLQQIYKKAHSLGLKVVFNTGVATWSDSLMQYCDFMNSSEIWHNEPLTRSQRKFAQRTWIETQEVAHADDAVRLTEAAWGLGFGAHYACYEYITLPDYSADYTAQIRLYQKPNRSLVLAIISALTLFVLLVAIIALRKRLKR